MKHDLPPFALLIDADNVPQDSIGLILEEISLHARVTVRRIYGDFTTPNLAGWKNRLAEHAIQPIQQYRNTVGKNASDSALIIDAMDLLHSGRFQGFCIVSSDSDFTRLAIRIREDGLVVFGFGEKKAPKAFVSACDRYIYVENLGAQAALPADTVCKPSVATSSAPASKNGNDNGNDSATTHDGQDTQADFLPPTDSVPLLMNAYHKVADDLGWAMLGQMSSHIDANLSDFDPRTYGCSKFIELVQKTKKFELELRPYKNGQSHFCRPRSAAARSPAATKAPSAEAPKASAKADGLPAELLQGIRNAVQESGGETGWVAVGIIGQKLKAGGHSIKSSGHATLTKALQASGLLEMKGSGSACYFRFRRAA